MRQPVGPTQRLMRSLLVLLALCVLGLIAGIVIVSIQNAQTNARLAILEEYLQGKGEQRDRETAALNRRIDDAVRQGKCDLLDQLPAGPLLDSVRGKYGCGPGIPLDQLPPEVQRELAGRSQPVAPPVDEPGQPLLRMEDMLPSEPPPDRPPPPLAEQELVPPEPPDPAPLVDLRPVTEQVCEALRVCG